MLLNRGRKSLIRLEGKISWQTYVVCDESRRIAVVVVAAAAAAFVVVATLVILVPLRMHHADQRH